MFLITLEDDEFRMPLFLQRLLERVNLQRTESARKCFLLISSDFLITKKQHLVFQERRANFRKDGIIELREMDTIHLGAQSSGDGIHRYVLVPVHPKEILLSFEFRGKLR